MMLEFNICDNQDRTMHKRQQHVKKYRSIQYIEEVIEG
jgi:hypothetical protein